MRRLLLALAFALVSGAALAQNVSTVTITNGVPTAGTGTVSTLDNLIGSAGSAKSNVLSIQGISGGTAANVTLSGTNNINNVSGTISLPTGAATSSLQSTINTSIGTGNTSLASIVTSTATIATNSGLPIPAQSGHVWIGDVGLQAQFPAASTPITGNATGTTGAVVGTLAGTSGETTYICGFDVSAIGGTAAVGPITVAGLVGSSMVYELASTATGVTLSREFNPCIPASATNTAITITTTADGTASAVAVNSHGFQQ